jgi:ferredoxin
MREKPYRKFLSRPTRRFIAEARNTENYSLLDLLHGYVYARWPYLYIGIGTGEHPIAKAIIRVRNGLSNLLKYMHSDNQSHDAARDLEEEGSFADTYHGKVISLESAKQLITIGEEISIRDLEHVIPYKQARDIVLQDPDHIIALKCPCRSSRPDPCKPLDVCLIIGEPFASFVLEHHQNKARLISSDEAVEILKQENDRGHVHHAFFKDAMFGRFYAICNCCACCCGAMQAHRNGTPMLASSGFVAIVEQEICIGCGTCEEICQFNTIHVQLNVALVDMDSCMGCGVCVDRCEQGAITLRREPSKGEPLILRDLMAVL